jgi:hypothetical protein
VRTGEKRPPAQGGAPHHLRLRRITYVLLTASWPHACGVPARAGGAAGCAVLTHAKPSALTLWTTQVRRLRAR